MSENEAEAMISDLVDLILGEEFHVGYRHKVLTLLLLRVCDYDEDTAHDLVSTVVYGNQINLEGRNNG